jgi:hypothetical protein
VSGSRGERRLGWALVFDGMVFEADVLQAVLETRGLVVQRRGGDEGFSLPGVSRTRLFVPEEDEAEARAVLAETVVVDQDESAAEGEQGSGGGPEEQPRD